MARLVGGCLALLLLALGLLGCSTDQTPPPAPATAGPAERLGVRAGWGPDRATLDRAARLAAGLSLRQLAGQVIVARYAGTQAPTDLVEDLHLGGVIVFADNVVSARQIQAVNRRLAEQAARPWPLFIGVDQEGGVVSRITGGVARFPALMSAGAADDPELTRTAMHGLGSELARLGFTADFAPVADVSVGALDPTIGSRSVGSDPELVAEHVQAAVAGFHDAGVTPVVKHFPGHGSAPADSHRTLPVLDRSRAELDAADLVPFARGISAGTVPAVMVGHLDVQAIDPGTPASLSRRVIDGVLRGDLGFDGLVVTDALDMAGVAQGRTSAETAIRALAAGADLLLMPPDPRQARDGIVAAVRAGELSRKRLRQAAARQIALALHQAGGRPHPDPAAAARDLSAAAITMVAGRCAGLSITEPLRPAGTGGTVAAFTAAATAAGLAVDAEARRGTRVAFTGLGGAPVTADIAVATDTPYVLAASDAPVKIATYGVTPGAMSALVEVLLGRAVASGRLPVPVAGVPRAGC